MFEFSKDGLAVKTISRVMRILLGAAIAGTLVAPASAQFRAHPPIPPQEVLRSQEVSPAPPPPPLQGPPPISAPFSGE
jgi:hypothetical protein